MQNRAPEQVMRAYASRFIKPNERLTSFERLEIYTGNIGFACFRAMIEDFPGLRAVLATGDLRL